MVSMADRESGELSNEAVNRELSGLRESVPMVLMADSESGG